MNKDFENVGWSEMQKILDRELPVVEKKRRRILLFWFLFAGVLTTFGAGFLYSKFNKDNQKLIAKNNQEECKNEPKFSTNSDKNSAQLIANNALINSNKKELKINEKTVNLNQNLAQLITENALINANKNELNLINLELKNNELIAQKNIAFNSKINAQNGGNKNDFESKISSEGTPQYMTDNGIPKIGKSEKMGILKVESCPQGQVLTQEIIIPLTINKLSKLNSNEVIENNLQNINFSIIKKTKKINSTHQNTHFGISTGVHTEGSSLISGWQFGLVLNRELNKKWSVSTGFNFRKTTVNVDSLAQLNASIYGSTTGATNDPKFGANSGIKIQLKDLNYAEMPINLVYNFNNKLSISGGIKMAYLISQNVSISADSSSLKAFDFRNDKLISTSSYADGASRSISALGLQRFDAAFIGGINYNLTNKIQLSLRYDYGVKNVLNRQNWTGYNRFLGVNAVYYFR
jgi:hypothetical protein